MRFLGRSTCGRNFSVAFSGPIGLAILHIHSVNTQNETAELIPNQQRTAALKLDWAKVSSSLGLRGQTAASLQAFKQRNDNARRRLAALEELPTTVDFAHYRSILKNTAIVDEVERRFNQFKPATYDVAAQLKAIEAFEAEAIRNAEATKDKVDLELRDLDRTLKNIEEARPFEDLTVVSAPCNISFLACQC